MKDEKREHFRQINDIDEEFKSKRLLGKGSLTCVFEINDEHGSDNVPTKAFKLTTSNEEMTEMLTNEFKILKDLDCKHIPAVYQMIADGNQIGMTMELGGKSFFDEIVDRRSFSEAKLAKFGVDLFSGLDYLHQRNIVHRDIKPENIVLKKRNTFRRETTLMIVDFSMATIVSDKKSYRLPPGTIHYCAPEALGFEKRRSAAMKAGDVYGMGAVLFTARTKSEIIYGDDDLELVVQNILQGNLLWDRLPPGTPEPESKYLQELTHRNWRRRPTALEAMNRMVEIHEWLNSSSSSRSRSADSGLETSISSAHDSDKFIQGLTSCDPSPGTDSSEKEKVSEDRKRKRPSNNSTFCFNIF